MSPSTRLKVGSGPLVLLVLDGWGLRESREGNAIKLARTPAYSELIDRFPHSSLGASGEEVGLPPGQMGNSEVGHITMGAGRVVYQDLTRIDKSIREGEERLMFAVLENAVECFQNNVFARRPSRKQLFKEAEEWFLDTENEALYSFENICETLGLHPDPIRKVLAIMRSFRVRESLPFFPLA